MPRVSTIIPAYNAQDFLGEAIESALAQTVPEVEVIVVDDGSTDDTPAIARAFGTRVRVCSGANRGVAAARNIGARAATGEWLAFLDADDLWSPSKLERQLAVTAPDVHFVYTDRYNIGDRGPLPERQSDLQPMYEGDVFEDLLVIGNVMTASSVLMRRALFSSLGGFCEEVPPAEDWDLWIRFAEHHAVRYCAEPLVSYRFHGDMASGDPRRMQRARVRVVERALALPRGAALPGRVKRHIWGATWMTNGWDAARRGYRRTAARNLLRAVSCRPLSVAPYRELGRLALGRH